jgi:transposase
MRAIPVSVRERIVQLYDRGKSTREIADVFGFCVSAVRRVRQLYKDRGTLEPQTHTCGRNTLLTEERKVRLLQLLDERPDSTLAELGAKMDRSFGSSTIDLWLCQLGWTYKKNSVRHRTKPSRRGQTKGRMA